MKYLLECHIFPELHPDLFSRHASPLEVDVMSAVVNISCPTRFVVDSMEMSNKGGGVAKVCTSRTGL